MPVGLDESAAAREPEIQAAPRGRGRAAAERGTTMSEGADKNVCWCFGYTAADIEADLTRNDGRSRLMEGIAAAKAAGGCRCAAASPLRR